jgi:polyribonucleotide nucleotidyltransferase
LKKKSVLMVVILKRFVRSGRNRLFPGAHGSAIFTRGETQSLTAVTLGSVKDANMVDSVIKHDEKFFLHYNFPPFSTGEARPLRGTSRREVGHGNLLKEL